MFEYLIDNKTVIFNSPEELNIGIAEAEEKGLEIVFVSGDLMSLADDPIEGPVEQQDDIIGKPGFLPDAAKSADVVSEILPAQDTELISEDGFSGLRYIKFKSGTTVYEDKYLEQYAGTGNYPESFDEYAKKFGTEAQTLPKDATTQGGELDQIVISTLKIKKSLVEK